MGTNIWKLLIITVLLIASPIAVSETLHDAVSKADLQQVIELVEAGADVNSKDEKGDTPLYLIFNRDQISIARYLITKGANVNQLDSHGHNLAHEAILHSNTEFLKILIASGVDLTTRDNKGLTPLDLAKEWKRDEMAEILGKKHK